MEYTMGTGVAIAVTSFNSTLHTYIQILFLLLAKLKQWCVIDWVTTGWQRWISKWNSIFASFIVFKSEWLSIDRYGFCFQREQLHMIVSHYECSFLWHSCDTMTHISDTFVTQRTPISDIVCSYLWHWVTLSWHRALIAHPPIIYPGWHRHPVGKRSWFRPSPLSNTFSQIYCYLCALWSCICVALTLWILGTVEEDCQSTKTSGPSKPYSDIMSPFQICVIFTARLQP